MAGKKFIYRLADQRHAFLKNSDALFILCASVAIMVVIALVAINLGQPLVRWKEGWGLREEIEQRLFIQCLFGIPTCIAVILWLAKAARNGLNPSGWRIAVSLVSSGSALLAASCVLFLYLFRSSVSLHMVSAWFPWADQGKWFVSPRVIASCFITAFMTWNLAVVALVIWRQRVARTNECRPDPHKFGWLLTSRVLTAIAVMLFVLSILLPSLHEPYRYIIAVLRKFPQDAPKYAGFLVSPERYHWALSLSAVFAVFAAVILAVLPDFIFPRWLTKILSAAFIIVVVLTIVDVSWPINVYHMNCYFLPANGILNGKCPPNDVNCQYGIGPPYFLAGVFAAGLIPRSLTGMSLVSSLLYVALYLMIYFILRLLRCGLAMSAAAVLALACWLFNAPYIASPDCKLASVCQGPPLRLLPILIMILFWLLHSRATNLLSKRLWNFLLYMVLGISCAWSIESAVLSTTAYIALTFSEFIIHIQDGARAATATLCAIRRLALAFLAVFVIHGILTVYTLARSGGLPRWDLYFDIVMKESILASIQPWAPWHLPALAIAAAIGWVAIQSFFGMPSQYKHLMPPVLAIAAAGALHFTYYVNYSLTYRIAYILPFPLILCAVFTTGIFRRRKRLPMELTVATMLVALFITIFPVALLAARGRRMNPLETCLGNAAIKSLAGNVNPLRQAWQSLWKGRVTNSDTPDNLALVKKYAGDRKRVALFVHKANNFDADLAASTGQTHLFPINMFLEDDLSSKTREHIMSYQHGLSEGDVIFVNNNIDNALMRDLINKLRSDFDFEVVETTRFGVAAIKLHTRIKTDNNKDPR